MNTIQLARQGIALAALAALSGLAAAASPNLLKNGNFEANSVTITGVATNSTQVTDWIYNTPVRGFAQVTTAFNTCATGNCFVSLEANQAGPGSLSQSFSATPGELLEVQFDYAMFSYAKDKVTTTPSTLSVSLNGEELAPVVLDLLSPNPRTVVPFSHYTTYVTAADLDKFEVDYSIGATSHLYLDNFSITAVPEPRNLALMACGLVAIVAVGRRRVA